MIMLLLMKMVQTLMVTVMMPVTIVMMMVIIIIIFFIMSVINFNISIVRSSLVPVWQMGVVQERQHHGKGMEEEGIDERWYSEPQKVGIYLG